jgi:hypothetical protein
MRVPHGRVLQRDSAGGGMGGGIPLLVTAATHPMSSACRMFVHGVAYNNRQTCFVGHGNLRPSWEASEALHSYCDRHAA